MASPDNVKVSSQRNMIHFSTIISKINVNKHDKRYLIELWNDSYYSIESSQIIILPIAKKYV